MTRQEVIDHLKKLSLKVGFDNHIKQKDIRTVSKLGYYIAYHFGTLGNALTEAKLENRASSLALKMSVKNEKLLEYLQELKNSLGKNPTEMDITRDREIYKIFSNKKFSYKIFRTRFGDLKKALEKLGQDKNVYHETKATTQNLEKENPEFFQNKNRFYGKAAEFHVTAELMYRGFQAANIPVDEGLDILAVKSNKTFYFQVKHKDLNNHEHIHITKSSFERRGGGDVYYIFVLLLNEARNFLVVPYHIINDWIRAGLVEERERGYSFFIKKAGDIYKLRDLDLNKYLNRWEDIK